MISSYMRRFARVRIMARIEVAICVARGKTIGALGRSEVDQEAGVIARVESREPSPEFAAMMADECRSLLGGLRDDSLRAVALLRMEGLTNEEVGQRLGCSLRTVARKMELIRRSWSSLDSHEEKKA